MAERKKGREGETDGGKKGRKEGRKEKENIKWCRRCEKIETVVHLVEM